jgi:iduronate 2-sulfatase
LSRTQYLGLRFTALAREFAVVDDLRPQIGPYNISDPANVLTPNLNKLASESTVFRRAYCNQAVCSPSRNSFLWGKRPRNTKIWNFKSSTRGNFPSWVTMPQYFKESLGYLTVGQVSIACFCQNLPKLLPWLPI